MARNPLSDASTMPSRITLKRGAIDNRYNVFFDGVKVGWVIKSKYGDDKGLWSAYAVTREPFYGSLLSRGNPTRAQAVKELLSDLAVWHLGRVWVPNYETHRDEAVYLPVRKVLEEWDQNWERAFAVLYPETKLTRP